VQKINLILFVFVFFLKDDSQNHDVDLDLDELLDLEDDNERRSFLQVSVEQ